MQIGVDDRFWQLGISKDLAGARDDDVANEQLSLQFGARPGDALVVARGRTCLPRDAPFRVVRTRRPLSAFVSSDNGRAQFGRFSLQPSQIPPMTFMPLQALQKTWNVPQVNTLLVAGADTERADAALRKHWRLADADLELREIPGGLELRTKRVFLEPHIAETAKSALPGAIGVLTYLVNELRFAERATPYSMVTATEIAGLREDEIIINSWLADDLGAKVGDELTLEYFVVAGQRNLREESRTFRIAEIKPLESPDTSWTPPFPGVSDVENCGSGNRNSHRHESNPAKGRGLLG